MNFIDGGVCAPKGFRASGIHCGIRKNKTKKDVALVVSDVICNSAAVYTTNKVKGSPLIVTKDHLKNGKAQAMICNSGIANTCNDDGEIVSESVCSVLSENTGINKDDVIVASTGVIGEKLNIQPFIDGMPELVSSLSYEGGKNAASAIMTTDTKEKEVAVCFTIDGKKCTIGAMSKGSGMINPNMATMLAFITTDVSISSHMINQALKSDVKDSFNMLSIDGDTSTNDMVSLMSNGLANNKKIVDAGDSFSIFCEALSKVTHSLCRMMAKDGEGASKLIECNVIGAKSKKDAKKIAKSIVSSTLLKSAIFGADANWGRVLCAIGYSGANVNIDKISISFISVGGRVDVCEKGSGISFSEETAKKVLSCDEIKIIVGLSDGEYSSTAWGCDLTYDYVKINGDYRT